MGAKRVDGKALADSVKAHLVEEIDELKKQGRTPHLVSVQVGENAASAIYMKSQGRACREVGITYTPEVLSAESGEDELISRIEELNHDPDVSGILLQLPLPESIPPRRIQARIAPDKDVEGVNPANMGMILAGNPLLAPCTALAVAEIVKSIGRPIRGLECTVVGSSEIVGKPLSLLMLNEFATLNVCHIETQDLAAHTRNADLLLVAVGKPGLISKEMVKPGAIVIDVGINRIPVLDDQGEPVLGENGRKKIRIVGDVDPDVEDVADHISPVPGGVGPMTVAMLLRNVVTAAKWISRQEQISSTDPQILGDLLRKEGHEITEELASAISEIVSSHLIKISGKRRTVSR